MNVYSWQIPKLQCQFRLTSSHCQTFSVHNKMKQNLNFISKYSSFQREHRGIWPLEQMHIGQYKQKESGSLFLGKTVKLMNTVKVQSLQSHPVDWILVFASLVLSPRPYV